jgi:hypothetical protein
VVLPEEQCPRAASRIYRLPPQSPAFLGWGGGDGMARKVLNTLQPVRETLQQLRQEGLIGVHLQRTFFGHWTQPLWRRKTMMWLYPRPRCPDRPSFEELSTAEVNVQIHKVLDLGVNPNPGSSPSSLQGGVAMARVSMLGPVLMAFMILSFHYTQSYTGSWGWSRRATRCPPAQGCGEAGVKACFR